MYICIYVYVCVYIYIYIYIYNPRLSEQHAAENAAVKPWAQRRGRVVCSARYEFVEYDIVHFGSIRINMLYIQ